MATGQSNSPYNVNSADMKDPSFYRLNSALTSINGRLGTVERDVGALKTSTTGGGGSASGLTSIVTVHADRGNFSAANYTVGSLLTETDRNSVYEVRLVSNVATWVFLSGRFTAAHASFPTDLGANDYGFQFFDVTYWRLFEWVATGAAPASTSPGWQRGPGELPSASVTMLPLGPGQMATGWHVCDGTLAVTMTQDDGSTTTIDVPDMVGAYPKGGTTGTYSPTQNPATPPEANGHTEIGNASISGTTSVDPGFGVTVQSGAGVNVAAHTHVHTEGTIADGGHFHNIIAADLAITMPGDPVANIDIPFYLRL